MMRVLMIAYFFPPMGDGGVFRSRSLARYLPGQGWQPVVLCGRPEDYWVRDDSLLDALPDDLQIHRVGAATGQALLRRFRRGKKGGGGKRSSRGFSLLRRLSDFFLLPDSYAGWISPALKEARAILAVGDIDLIYSSGPPDSSHRVAARLSRESGLPWVADFRDPWFNLHLKKPPTLLHRLLHRLQERDVLRRAHVVAVTEGWLDYYRSRSPRQATLIRNGFDPADFSDVPPSPVPGENGEIRILHTGKLSLGRSSRPFLTGLDRYLRIRPDLRERIRVDFLGPRESDNEQIVAQLGLGDVVRFHDPVSHHESIQWQRASQLLLLIKHDDARYRDLIPGKFYEYAASGRPVLAVTPPGEVERLLHRYRLGWALRPSAEAVARGLEEAISAIARGWTSGGDSLEELTRPHQAGQMARLFNSCLESGKDTMP